MDPIRKISVLRSLVIKSLIDIIFVEKLGLKRRPAPPVQYNMKIGIWK